LNKPKFKTSHAERILAEHDRIILRLPPYCPELNAIEKILAIVKKTEWLQRM
jgi:transposase